MFVRLIRNRAHFKEGHAHKRTCPSATDPFPRNHQGTRTTLTVQATVFANDVFVAAGDAAEMDAEPIGPKAVASFQREHSTRKARDHRTTDFSNIVFDRLCAHDHIANRHVVDQPTSCAGAHNEVPLALSEQVLRLHPELRLAQPSDSQRETDVWDGMASNASAT
jgi:hypothetical protein